MFHLCPLSVCLSPFYGVTPIHEKIQETETVGLKLNAAGVWWLFSGTVCSTFPEELVDAVAKITT